MNTRPWTIRIFIITYFACLFINPLNAQNTALVDSGIYLNNKAPLRPNPYLELPIGAIQPLGWLKEQLLRMKNGMTGNLDINYPRVMGKRNGWLGGDGDQWERGPYWIDGLLPLAYILNDQALKNKVQPWIEWTIKSQQPDGYFGPKKDYPNTEEGLQRDNSRDWWPKMVMLKVLQQYYNATGDQRVITLMTNYFKYQLQELPETKLDHYSWWGAQRGGDNLLVVYWLYNITGDKYLLDLAELIHKQTADWTGMMQTGEPFEGYFKLHGVNVAQGIKEPIIYYQQNPKKDYLDATKKGFWALKVFHGQPQGLFGADELLHGNSPTQGSELCTAVEMMYSLENMLRITNDISFADHLEKIAFNALPTQSNESYTGRQYYQQPNQVMITRDTRNFVDDHNGTDQCYGLLTGYPCCTANMHQGWPKFTQNLWYATADKGVAGLLYAPSEVKIKVANNTPITITETTQYPFSDKINFRIKSDQPVDFPFHLRIPQWCKQAIIKINNESYPVSAWGQVVVISRTWKNNDVVELQLPMAIKRSRWCENAITVERGPLIFGLKIEEKWTRVDNKDKYGPYYEVHPLSAWNYGLINIPDAKIQDTYKIIQKENIAAYPWTLQDAPIEIRVPARRLPFWQLYQNSAGPLPYSTQRDTKNLPATEIVLIPYGCTKLRISEFPEVR